MTPHEQKVIAAFQLLWGIAPPDSLKGKKGVEIEQLILDALREQRKDLYKKVQLLSDTFPEPESDAVDAGARRMKWAVLDIIIPTHTV